MKTAPILLSVGTALVLMAWIGLLAPAPGHPGGFYLQIVSSGYGVKFLNVSGGDAKHAYNVHVSPDNLSATVNTFGGVRDTYAVNFTLKEEGDENAPIFINAYADPGVEVDFKGKKLFENVTYNVTHTENVTYNITYWVVKVWLDNWEDYNSPDAPILIYTKMNYDPGAVNKTGIYNGLLIYDQNNTANNTEYINVTPRGYDYIGAHNYTKINITPVNDTNLFGYIIHVWQFVNYTKGDDKYNATANVTVYLLINKSAIGCNGSEVVNLTVNGTLYVYEHEDNEDKSNTMLVNYHDSLIFNGSSYNKTTFKGSTYTAGGNDYITEPESQILIEGDKIHASIQKVTKELTNQTTSTNQITNEILKSVTKVKHIGPGRWVLQTNDTDGMAVVIMYVYPNPIASGDKTVRVTFTRQ